MLDETWMRVTGLMTALGFTRPTLTVDMIESRAVNVLVWFLRHIFRPRTWRISFDAEPLSLDVCTGYPTTLSGQEG